MEETYIHLHHAETIFYQQHSILSTWFKEKQQLWTDLLQLSI